MNPSILATRLLRPVLLSVAAALIAPISATAQHYLEVADPPSPAVVSPIDIESETLSDMLTLTVKFGNDGETSDGRPLALVLASHTPFPVWVTSVETYDNDLVAVPWYSVAEAAGTLLTPEGVVLAWNILPNSDDCGGDPASQPPCEYTLEVELEIGLALDGVLAPQGLHALSLQLVEDVSPIELDFTDFFCGIEAITEGCEE